MKNWKLKLLKNWWKIQIIEIIEKLIKIESDEINEIVEIDGKLMKFEIIEKL